jgi:hypothetical protein
VEIKGEIVADGLGGPAGGAHTAFVTPRFRFPGFRSDRAGKILGFDGKFTWIGAIAIQTRYGAGVTANSVSCYGRGTTPEDVRNRDITLGFHENCHQFDFVSYLSDHPLPEPPTLTSGIDQEDYHRQIATFEAQVEAYFKSMEEQSECGTDEVGHTLSRSKQEGCFVHDVSC